MRSASATFGLRLAALAAYCDAISGPRHVHERMEAADRMIELTGMVDDQALTLLARRIRLVALFEQGLFALADGDIAAYARIAEQLRLPLFLWPVPIWRGMRALTEPTGNATGAGAVKRLGDEVVGAQFEAEERIASAERAATDEDGHVGHVFRTLHRTSPSSSGRIRSRMIREGRSCSARLRAAVTGPGDTRGARADRGGEPGAAARPVAMGGNAERHLSRGLRELAARAGGRRPDPGTSTTLRRGPEAGRATCAAWWLETRPKL